MAAPVSFSRWLCLYSRLPIRGSIARIRSTKDQRFPIGPTLRISGANGRFKKSLNNCVERGQLLGCGFGLASLLKSTGMGNLAPIGVKGLQLLVGLSAAPLDSD